MYGVLMAIDSFTGHGVYSVVPDVKGKSLNDAVGNLATSGFKGEVSDSTYSDAFPPGVVIDQEPKEGSKIKPLRTIYLTMNAISPREVSVPSLVDMSCRQGLAILNGLGFKNVRVDTIYSPYKDLIVSIKVNGKNINNEERLPITSAIVISVGNGMSDVLPDSIEAEETEYLELGLLN